MIATVWPKLSQHLVKFSLWENTSLWFPKLKLRGSEADSRSYLLTTGLFRENDIVCVC